MERTSTINPGLLQYPHHTETQEHIRRIVDDLRKMALIIIANRTSPDILRIWREIQDILRKLELIDPNLFNENDRLRHTIGLAAAAEDSYGK